MDEANLKALLEGIVATRQTKLPSVDQSLHRLDRVREALVAMSSLASELPAEWSNEPDIHDALARLSDTAAASQLRSAREALESVRARFSRGTINIGVSGRARVGKSTLLQSVSGLTDDQVPTGEDANVTAVRSRLFHASATRAHVTFHSPTSFMDEVVRPYLIELEILPPPLSLPAFRAFGLEKERDERRRRSELRVDTEQKWDRLLQIQRALPRVEPLLGAGELELTDLSDLRRFVAYPTTAAVKEELTSGAPADRSYLAVRDCRIEAPFPYTAVDRLGIVDLPGLGEVAAGIDERIVTGLRDEVDVVLLMKRAAVGLANIDDTDTKAALLIEEARASSGESRDFAWIVINAGPGDEARVDALKVQIRQQLNGGDVDSRYRIAVADARDAHQVHEEVLAPVLTTLAERLPDIDDQVLRQAVEAGSAPMAALRASLEDLLRSIERVRTASGSPRERLDQLAEDLRMDLQQSLERVKPERMGDAYVDKYLVRVNAINQEVRLWLEDGLGRFPSRDDWLQHASRRRGVDASLSPLAIEELHRLRVAITSKYSELDEYLNDVLVEDFYGSLAEAIAGEDEASARRKSGAHVDALLGDRADSKSDQILTFLKNLNACDPPIPGLSRAVARLTNLRFDFRMQSYPVLHDLSLDARPRDGEYPPDFDSVEVMYEWFLDEAREYSHRVRQALSLDAARQFRVLSGAAVVFEDEFIRAGTAKVEVRSLADGYRDELWPGVFDDVNANSARASAYRRLVQEALVAIDEAARV